MQAHELIRRLQQHRAWVNKNLLTSCKDLTEQQLHQSFQIGQGSIWKSLTHMYAAESVWLEVLLGNDRHRVQGDLPGKLPGNQQGDDRITSLDELKNKWSILEQRWDDYLALLQSESLNETVYRVSSSVGAGTRIGTSRSDVLLHVCTHAQYTTAQMVNMLRQAGVEKLPETMLISLARQEASESCELTPHQLRKLAAAAGYYRALLAVHCDEENRAIIWGMVSTGADWVSRVDAASDRHDDLPENLVIHCLGPGHLIASAGYARVLESANGRILMDGFDPFRSTWLPKRFGRVRADLLQLIDSQDHASSRMETRMCDDFVRDLAQKVVRQTLRLVPTRGHGGMLVYLPDAIVGSEQLQSWLRFRVQFEPDDSTLRFRRVMLQVIARAREIGHSLGMKTVTYKDYRRMSDMELVAL